MLVLDETLIRSKHHSNAKNSQRTPQASSLYGFRDSFLLPCGLEKVLGKATNTFSLDEIRKRIKISYLCLVLTYVYVNLGALNRPSCRQGFS